MSDVGSATGVKEDGSCGADIKKYYVCSLVEAGSPVEGFSLGAVDTARSIHRGPCHPSGSWQLHGCSLGLDTPKETGAQQLHSFRSSPVTKCQHLSGQGITLNRLDKGLCLNENRDSQPEACKMRRWN